MSNKEKNQDGMLALLATKHDDWVRIAKSFTNSQEDAEDLVQRFTYVSGKLARLSKK